MDILVELYNRLQAEHVLGVDDILCDCLRYEQWQGCFTI
jgi:hypothetical protein